MDIRLTHLRTFREVARRGSFSRAAEALRLSQPAVSLHVRQLEEAFGTALLERVGKRAFPTAAGEIVLAHGERAFAQIEAARTALSQRSGAIAGRVRLGTGATASIHLLPPLLRRMRLRHPAVELTVTTGNTREITQAVVDNALDLAVVTLPVGARELTVTPFYEDSLVVIAPPDPHWKKQRRITPTELARHPLILFERGGAIRTVMDAWFALGRAAPSIAMELGNAEASKKLVGAGLGLSIISSIAVKHEARTGELVVLAPVPRLSRTLGLIRRRDKPVAPALASVIEALDSFARKSPAAQSGSPRVRLRSSRSEKS